MADESRGPEWHVKYHCGPRELEGARIITKSLLAAPADVCVEAVVVQLISMAAQLAYKRHGTPMEVTAWAIRSCAEDVLKGVRRIQEQSLDVELEQLFISADSSEQAVTSTQEIIDALRGGGKDDEAGR